MQLHRLYYFFRKSKIYLTILRNAGAGRADGQDFSRVDYRVIRDNGDVRHAYDVRSGVGDLEIYISRGLQYSRCQGILLIVSLTGATAAYIAL